MTKPELVPRMLIFGGTGIGAGLIKKFYEHIKYIFILGILINIKL